MAATREILDSLAKIPDSLKRSVYIQELSKIVKQDESILFQELNKITWKKEPVKKRRAEQELEKIANLNIENEGPIVIDERQEKDIIRWINYSGIQAMNCGCTVVAEKTSSKRREIKELIESLRKVHPDIDQSIYTSATNVNLDAILGYHKSKVKTHFNEMYEEREKKI